MQLLKLHLPKFSRALVLEDSPMRQEWFRKRLPDCVVVKNIEEFKAFFQRKPVLVDFVFLDHDLGGPENGTGVDAAKYILDTFGYGGNKYIMIHSWNMAGVAEMKKFTPGALTVPFGDFEVEVEE